MKEADAIKAFLSGTPLVIVEYRSFRADRMKWVDKKTDQKREAVIVEHGVEIGDQQVRVSEFAPDGTDPAALKSSFTKGQRCVLRLETLDRINGTLAARGKLEPLVS